MTPPRARPIERGLGRWVQVEQEVAELGETGWAESSRPVGLYLADRLADDADSGLAAGGEGDAFRSQVVGVSLAFEVVEALELAEQVVDCLLGHPQPGGQLGGPGTLRSRILEDVQVGGVEVGETALVQPFEHVPLHQLPGKTQQGADQRRPDRVGLSASFRKVT
jgi:hypothetical protein